MIWWQTECKAGDMIRISFGNFYHYGIFVSEEEVIQFGLPPFEGLLNRKNEDIAVCISDIDTFSGGKVVEVATPEKSDKKKRLSPKKTIQRAREKLGERGYDILHNNCEHFARYCYFGEKRCEVTESVVSSWKNKPICNVFISLIPDEINYETLTPKERNEEVLSVSNETVKKSKYWVWKTLEYAFFRTFGYKILDLDLTKTKNGKWVSEKCYFSLSHSKNAVAVAVSNRETGIDIEESASFYKKFEDEKTFELFIKKILSKRETTPKNRAELLTLWTKKECLFKASKLKGFMPTKLCTEGQEISTGLINLGEKDFVISVFGKESSAFQIYNYDGQSATRFKDIKWF